MQIKMEERRKVYMKELKTDGSELERWQQIVLMYMKKSKNKSLINLKLSILNQPNT